VDWFRRESPEDRLIRVLDNPNASQSQINQALSKVAESDDIIKVYDIYNKIISRVDEENLSLPRKRVWSFWSPGTIEAADISNTINVVDKCLKKMPEGSGYNFSWLGDSKSDKTGKTAVILAQRQNSTSSLSELDNLTTRGLDPFSTRLSEDSTTLSEEPAGTANTTVEKIIHFVGQNNRPSSCFARIFSQRRVVNQTENALEVGKLKLEDLNKTDSRLLKCISQKKIREMITNVKSEDSNKISPGFLEVLTPKLNISSQNKRINSLIKELKSNPRSSKKYIAALKELDSLENILPLERACIVERLVIKRKEDHPCLNDPSPHEQPQNRIGRWYKNIVSFFSKGDFNPLEARLIRKLYNKETAQFFKTLEGNMGYTILKEVEKFNEKETFYSLENLENELRSGMNPSTHSEFIKLFLDPGRVTDKDFYIIKEHSPSVNSSTQMQRGGVWDKDHTWELTVQIKKGNETKTACLGYFSKAQEEKLNEIIKKLSKKLPGKIISCKALERKEEPTEKYTILDVDKLDVPEDITKIKAVNDIEYYNIPDSRGSMYFMDVSDEIKTIWDNGVGIDSLGRATRFCSDFLKENSGVNLTVNNLENVKNNYEYIKNFLGGTPKAEFILGIVQQDAMQSFREYQMFIFQNRGQLKIKFTNMDISKSENGENFILQYKYKMIYKKEIGGNDVGSFDLTRKVTIPIGELEKMEVTIKGENPDKRMFFEDIPKITATDSWSDYTSIPQQSEA
jgi:hypothetical protein